MKIETYYSYKFNLFGELEDITSMNDNVDRSIRHSSVITDSSACRTATIFATKVSISPKHYKIKKKRKNPARCLTGFQNIF